MDRRDFTTMLCLVLPWGAALLWKIAGRQVWVLLVVYILAVMSWNLSTGRPVYPELRYPRTRDLVHLHPETVTFLQSLDRPPAIVTDVEYLFAPYPDLGVAGWPKRSLRGWLQAGTCYPDRPVVVILFEEEEELRLNEGEDARTLRELVEQKCPDIRPTRLADSVVYALGGPSPVYLPLRR
jgi:hypothetical protein